MKKAITICIYLLGIYSITGITHGKTKITVKAASKYRTMMPNFGRSGKKTIKHNTKCSVTIPTHDAITQEVLKKLITEACQGHDNHYRTTVTAVSKHHKKAVSKSFECTTTHTQEYARYISTIQRQHKDVHSRVR